MRGYGRRMASPGDLDTSFSGDGKKTISFGGVDIANVVLVQPNGRIVVAGGGAAADRFCVARLRSNGVLDIMPTGGSVFGMNVPAQQVVQQIAAAIGQDPSNLSPGFMVDRLFTCKSVMIVDGRVR